MQRLALFLLLFLTTSTLSYGQTARSAHWYFGHKAGIYFSSGTPAADTNGKIVSIEGSCSISDLSGNLLFYSDGTEIRNREHTIMPNGSGIDGNQSAIQGCIIIPIPAHPDSYYLFSTSVSGTVSYSKIDMTLDGGLGDVTTQKNNLLMEHSSEAIAATIHCNQTNYWVIVREIDGTTLKFRAYEISASGIAAPVTSSFPLPGVNTDPVASITFTETGNVMSYSALNFSPVYLFDFDQQTGQLSFKDSIVLHENEMTYSIAFSGSETKLYASLWDQHYCRISQFDLNATDIAASRVNLDSVYFGNGSPNGYGFVGQIRLAPTHQLLISRWTQNNLYIVNAETPYSLDSLDVIHNPDLAGYAAGYQRNYLYLNHRPAMLGLPNFVSTFTGEVDPDFHCPPGTASLRENGVEGIEIYPNPVKTVLTIGNASFQQLEIELLDNTGKHIQSVTSSDKAIGMDMNERSTGMYFVRITTNEITETFRIVKQ